MTVTALESDYTAEMKDRAELFHGNQLLYIGWDWHLMYCSALCILVPPAMHFGTLVENVIPGLYAAHPDAGRIDWRQVIWLRSGQVFQPEPGKTLVENGLGHKAILRFRTPGLNGIGESRS